MTKFIIEYKGNKYTMSFIDDYLPSSTSEKSSMGEAIYEMSSIFKDRIRNRDSEMLDSMRRVSNLSKEGKLPIEFIGINLMDSDALKDKISKTFGTIAEEYVEYLTSKQMV